MIVLNQPIVGDFVSVYFPHEHWDQPTHRFSKDIRSMEEPTALSWDMHIETNTGSPVHLTFEGMEDVPGSQEVWLIDNLLDIQLNLREQPNYVVSADQTSRQLTLVVGPSSTIAERVTESADAPQQYALHQNFPNPFQGTTTLAYSLPQSDIVSLRVFNMLGQEIATLLENRTMDTGNHGAVWDGRATNGDLLPSGVYFASLETSSYSKTIKMVLVR